MERHHPDGDTRLKRGLKSAESDTDDVLRRLPRLRMEASTSARIFVNLEDMARAESSIQPRRRKHGRLWQAIVVAVAFTAVLSSALVLNHPQGAKAVLAGWTSYLRATANRPQSSTWLTESGKRDLAIQAIANLYGGSEVRVVGMKLNQTEVTHQPMYVVQLAGRFRQGTGAKTHQVTATHLSFSILADGSRVWAITANDGTPGILWSYNSTLPIHIQQLVYWGHSPDWAAVYRQATASVWRANHTDNRSEFGSATKSSGYLQYVGSTGQTPPNFNFQIRSGGNSESGQGISLVNGKIQLGNLQVNNPKESITVVVTMGGKKQSFVMTNVER